MASVFDLFAYEVEVNWRLMWFPVNSEAAWGKEVKVRTSSFRLLKGDVPSPQAPKVQHYLGKGTGDGSKLDLDFPVDALLEIGTGTSHSIEADIELRLGTIEHIRTTVIVEPSARTPFMLSLHPPSRPMPDGDLGETAAVVDGVFNAGSRFKLSDLWQFIPVR